MLGHFLQVITEHFVHELDVRCTPYNNRQCVQVYGCEGQYLQFGSLHFRHCELEYV